MHNYVHITTYRYRSTYSTATQREQQYRSEVYDTTKRQEQQQQHRSEGRSNAAATATAIAGKKQESTYFKINYIIIIGRLY